MAVAALALLAMSTAGAQVTRVELRFDDDRGHAVVERGGQLTAVAHVSHRGGMLRGRWQVSEPPATPSNPRYRTLAMVQLLLAGSGESIVESPPLPTGTSGAYQVRLVLDGVGHGVDHDTALRYQVIAP